MAYSAFENDYKILINNILRDIYRNTDYWGIGPAGNPGIIRPITSEDDPNWSYYNFINTHWTVRDKIVLPFLSNPPIEKDKKYTESESNANFFKNLWKRRLEIFGPNSSLKDEIIKAITKTRKSGTKRENFIKVVLESIEGVKVNMIAEAGGTQDFMGIDIIIDSKNNVLSSGSAQVKPFRGLTVDKNNWSIDTDLRREYKTDYMIFGKQSGVEYHVAVFKNDSDSFTFLPDGKLLIPRNLIKLLINYNTITGKSTLKSY